MALISPNWELSITDMPIVEWANIEQNDGINIVNINPPFVNGEGVLVVHGDLPVGTLKLYGSHNQSKWVIIKDRSGDEIEITSVNIPTVFSIPDLFPYIRPVIFDGSTTQDVTVTLHLKG